MRRELSPREEFPVRVSFPKFAVDATGTVKMGSSAQYFALGSLSNVRLVAGTVRNDGTIARGAGFTVTKLGTGHYRINYSEGSGGGTVITVTPSVPATGVSWNLQDGSGVQVFTHRPDGSQVDAWFNFIAVGFR